MARSANSQTPAKRGKKASAPATSSPSSSPKNIYLILYNLVSAVLWSAVLGRTVLIAAQHGPSNVFFGVGELTKWTQTLAGLEILHAAIGIVRAPLLTTVMQVASRFLLVWGIVFWFPPVAVDPVYASMLVAWSVTEVIRYSYFAVNLARGSVPGWLMWLRYNTFFILYPMGISSECWLVWKSIEPAKRWNMGLEWALYGVLAIYVPGAYVLFTHMIAQRRKIMRGPAKGGKKQK